MKLGLTDILKVFYAPHKVFKEIAQRPSYIAPLIVLIIFVIVQTGSSYIIATQSLVEQTMPSGENGDIWTENAAFWQANPGVAITNNTVDHVNSSASFYGGTIPYLGNGSIEFKADNNSIIQIALATLDGSVNCGASGYKNMSFRVKIVEPSAIPDNVSIYLYSLNDFNSYTYDLTPEFANSLVNVWNNITIPVGSGDWSISGSPNWENITSLQIIFTWQNESSIDLLVDGLFFRGVYQDLLSFYGSTYMFSSLFGSVTTFLFHWIVLTAIIYLLVKGLKGSLEWKPLMIAIGVVLTILIVQALILIVSYTVLLNVHYPLEFVAGVPGESQVASQAILDSLEALSLIIGTVQIAILAWNALLGVFVVRAVTAVAPATLNESVPSASQPFSWTKCFLISVASVLLTLVVGYFLGF